MAPDALLTDDPTLDRMVVAPALTRLTIHAASKRWLR